MRVRFESSDLDLFAAASGDVNPFHMSEDYARRSAIGERVVFGMLGAWKCLGLFEPPAGFQPAEIRVEFRHVLLLGIDYSFELRDLGRQGHAAILSDGGRIILVLKISYKPGNPALCSFPGKAPMLLRQATVLHESELAPGLARGGEYTSQSADYEALVARCGVERKRWGDAVLLAFLSASYAVGMEIPGENAVFAGGRIEILDAAPALPATFSAAVEEWDTRYRLLKLRFNLAKNGAVFVRGQLSSSLRNPRTQPRAISTSSGLEGQTAIVVGASRGFGAALALDLASRGATVYAVYSRSLSDAEALVSQSESLPGRIVLAQGDAGDTEWCGQLTKRALEETGRLDLLVLGAIPALNPLRLDPAFEGRINSFLHSGFRLVLAPLLALVASHGENSASVLLVSSSFMTDAPKEWPHYVALKGAAESLLQTCVSHNPKLTAWIARLGKMRTDLTNIGAGWENAEVPESVARRVIDRVLTAPGPGIHYC